MTTIVETNRLLLRRFDISDSSFILKLVNSEGWLQYIGDRNIHSIDDAITYIVDGPLKSEKINGYGLACIILKATNDPIGMCGLVCREFLSHPDLGFAILPEYQGNGYMQEIATAYLDYIKNEIKLITVLGITVRDNLRSVSLLERLGFSFKSEIILPGQDEQLLLFSISFQRATD